MKKRKLFFRWESIFIIVALISISCGFLDIPTAYKMVLTPTLMNTSLTTTIEPLPSKVKTPFPSSTLTSLEKEDFLWEAIGNNTSCKLPCWMDISPGVSTWEEVNKLLVYLGIRYGSKPENETNTILHGTGGFDFDGIVNRIGFYERSGMIDSIFVYSEGYNAPQEFQSLWSNYSIKNILYNYNVPDRVWLNITEIYSESRGYHIWLFYDEMGFAIRYSGDTLDDLSLRVCPTIKSMFDINLYLQHPDNPLPLERFDAILEDIRLQTETGKTRVVYSIEEATGMNEKEFHELFMQEEEIICFETPSNIWDIKQ